MTDVSKTEGEKPTEQVDTALPSGESSTTEAPTVAPAPGQPEGIREPAEQKPASVSEAKAETEPTLPSQPSPINN